MLIPRRTGLILVLGMFAASAGLGQDASPPATDGKLPYMLDLSRFQKPLATLNGETNIVASIMGRKTFDGLPFQIDGQTILFGQSFLSRTGVHYPESVEGIKIGRKFDELHLIHYAAWLDSDGTTLATLRLNYADGTHAELPIIYGVQVRDWYQQPSEVKEKVSDSDTKICWRSNGPDKPKNSLRLFKSRLKNPHSDKVVSTMDIISADALSSYILVAATVAEHAFFRTTTPPMPWIEEDDFDGKVAIHVVDDTSGKPLAGVDIITIFKFESFQNWAPSLHTSAGGEAVVHFPTDRVTSMSLSFAKEGYAPNHIHFPENKIPTESTIRLVPVEKKGP